MKIELTYGETLQAIIDYLVVTQKIEPGTEWEMVIENNSSGHTVTILEGPVSGEDQ